MRKRINTIQSFIHGTWICTKCLERKDWENFPRDKGTKYGYSARCKSCLNLEARQRYNTDEVYRLQNIATTRQWQEKTKFTRDKHRDKDRKLRRAFGLSLEEYTQMLQSQNNVCAICLESTNRNLAVDHSHKSGKIRGLLCSSCNTGLGLFKDSIERLHKVITYLEVNGE